MTTEVPHYTVLLVEDDFYTQTFISAALERGEQVRILVADNVADALKFLKEEKIDLALLDYNLKDGETSQPIVDAIHCLWKQAPGNEVKRPGIFTISNEKDFHPLGAVSDYLKEEAQGRINEFPDGAAFVESALKDCDNAVQNSAFGAQRKPKPRLATKLAASMLRYVNPHRPSARGLSTAKVLSAATGASAAYAAAPAATARAAACGLH